MAALKEKINADENFVRYKRILKFVSSQINKDQLFEEAKAKHAKRLSRNFKGLLPTPQEIYKAQIVDMNTRGRFIDIRAHIHEQYAHLEDCISTTRLYIYLAYFREHPSFKTIADRKDAASRFVSEGKSMLAELKALAETLELYIKDIDQAGYSLKNSVELLKLMGPNNPTASS